MKFTRRQDREVAGVRLSGGVYIIRPTDEDQAALIFHFYRPLPGDVLRIAADVTALRSRLKRYQLDLYHYMRGAVDADAPPKLSIDVIAIQPVIDWVGQHLTKIEGLVDEMTGEAFGLHDLDADDLNDLLIQIDLDNFQWFSSFKRDSSTGLHGLNPFE